MTKLDLFIYLTCLCRVVFLHHRSTIKWGIHFPEGLGEGGPISHPSMPPQKGLLHNDEQWCDLFLLITSCSACLSVFPSIPLCFCLSVCPSFSLPVCVAPQCMGGKTCQACVFFQACLPWTEEAFYVLMSFCVIVLIGRGRDSQKVMSTWPVHRWVNLWNLSPDR